MTEIPEEDFVPVSAELVLASVLKTLGKVSIPVDSFMQNYDNCQIKVDQDVEDFVTLELVEVSNEGS